MASPISTFLSLLKKDSEAAVNLIEYVQCLILDNGILPLVFKLCARSRLKRAELYKKYKWFLQFYQHNRARTKNSLSFSRCCKETSITDGSEHGFRINMYDIGKYLSEW